LAEWKWGAGQGCRNIIFLTFGTGMGAGLILDGKLYSGTNDLAGEVGHIRLETDGPVGYGKSGSFEGFCSGGGIAQLAQGMALKRIKAGDPSPLCPTLEEVPLLTAEKVGHAAERGDSLALEIYRISAYKLGLTLAILIDILNPERIIIGSIYARQKEIMEPYVMAALQAEALPLAQSNCQVLPAALGDRVGDYASLSVAYIHSPFLRSRVL
jgi:glucokinase